jgi:site-specific DNA-methyltransferase (adenine-specific)
MKLINGDVISELKKLPSESVNCIVTSPPYWKGFEYESYFNSYNQYLKWSEKWLRECKRVLHRDGYFFLNVANDSETTVRVHELLNICTNKVMFKLHDTIIWYVYNRQPANTNRQLTNQHEYIFMLRHSSNDIDLNKKELYEYNPSIFKTKNVGNVWEIPFNRNKNNFSFKKKTKSKWGHNGFPLDIPLSCILLSTKENDVVLDCFMGSGTTAVACKKLNRKFIGIDIMEEYVELTKLRLGDDLND